LTETLFPEAIARAKYLDGCYAKTGRVIGPLHGVPISLKDNFNIAGKASSVGFAALADTEATSNSSLVDILLRLGAVVYVKTNVPTAMMIAESVNNVFGRYEILQGPSSSNLTLLEL
jgi:amidase